MKTIIVDHDNDTELAARGRFNAIVPLLLTYGAEPLHTWSENANDEGIISPSELNQHFGKDVNILYTLTSRIPEDDPALDGANGDRRWLHEISTEIPKHIVEYANSGKLHIAYFVGEIINITPKEILETVNQQLELAGLLPEAITVYIPNFQLHELGVSYIKFISIFEMSYYGYLAKAGLPISKNVIQEVNMERRNKKFTCLNHLSKAHRMCFAGSLYNTGRHLKGYFSYIGQDFIDGEPGTLLKNLSFRQFENHIPFLLDTDDAEAVNYHWRVKKPFFNDAYWNFVTESFYADYYSLTEKTFKPLVNLQPFIIVGAPGSLETLHKLGYQTFSSVIDESYDYELNHNKRMEKLIALSYRLTDMTDAQHMRIMRKIEPILKHNQEVFFNKDWKEML